MKITVRDESDKFRATYFKKWNGKGYTRTRWFSFNQYQYLEERF